MTRKRFAKKKQQEKNQEKLLLVVRNYKHLSVIGMKVSTKLSTPNMSLKAGTNQEAKDKNNKTPLHIAHKNDQIKRGNKKIRHHPPVQEQVEHFRCTPNN